jgi:cell division protease FtsH
LANILLEKEVIFKENVEEIFGKRPWDKEEPTEVEATEVEATETEVAEAETVVKEASKEGEEVAAADE